MPVPGKPRKDCLMCVPCFNPNNTLRLLNQKQMLCRSLLPKKSAYPAPSAAKGKGGGKGTAKENGKSGGKVKAAKPKVVVTPKRAAADDADERARKPKKAKSK